MQTDLSALQVLLVDDTDYIRKQAAEHLQALGIAPTEVENGIVALKALREKTFDLVISDIVMPEMDGFELIEEIRKSPALKGMPIVVSSTYADSNHVVKALKLGADDFLPKPTDGPTVERVVRRVLIPLFEVR